MGKPKKSPGLKRNKGKKFHWKEPTEPAIHQVKSKSLFRDRRLGEKNPNLDEEAKALMKFSRERALISRKKMKFELDEDFPFTHRGKKIMDLPDDYLENDEISEEEPVKKQRVTDEIVNNEHFGEGLTRGKRDLYSDMILKSKTDKLLRKREKEDNLDLVLELDHQFSSLKNSLKLREKRGTVERDAYDIVLADMQHEANWCFSLGEREKQGQHADSVRSEFLKAGENWELPNTYREFFGLVSGSPLENIVKMKIWVDCERVKSARSEKSSILIRFCLEYLSGAWELEGVYSAGGESDMIQTLRGICRENAGTSIEAFLAIGATGRELSLNYVSLYHLLGVLFDPSDENSLSSVFIELTCYMFMHSCIVTPTQVRDLLLLAYAHWEVWMKPYKWYSPELVHGLVRILSQLGTSVYSSYRAKDLFTSADAVYSLCYDLYISIFTVFQREIGFKLAIDHLNIFFPSELHLVTEPTNVPVGYTLEKPKEIPTYEPCISSRITSFKQDPDSNKELRREHKKQQKICKKALRNEVETYHKDQLAQRRLVQQKNEQQQKQVRHLLDQLQSEYKKESTANDLAKKKKKKKQRLGGNKFS